MGTLRVHSAALRLRLPEGSKETAPRVSDVVRHRFIPAVLDNLRRELDAECGETAVIRIPKLRLKLRIGPGDTDGAALARQIARDLADEVRASLTRPQTARAMSTPQVRAALWPNRADYMASALIAAVEGRPGPENAVDEITTVFETFLAADVADAVRTLERVESDGAFDNLLDALPPRLLRALLMRISRALPPVLVDRMSARLGEGPPRRPSDPGAVPGEGETGATDARAPDPAPGQDRPDETLRTAETGHDPSPPDPASTPRKPHAPRRKDAGLPAAPGKADAARRADPAASDDAASVARAEAPGEPAPPERSGREHAGPSDTRAGVPRDAPRTFATDLGLLPCLLNVALRLEMPERLWRIGVPEGSALAAMMRAATGHPTDPMIGLLAPGFPAPPPPVPPLPGWARTEFRDAVAEVARALTDGGVTASRIESRRLAIAETAEWRVDEWGAAALLAVIDALVRSDPGAPGWDARLRVPGAIDILPGEIAVRLPPDAVDLDLRRAGLDRDPGWLAWLDRRMTLHFGTHDEDWAT